ncbi:MULTISPECIES: bifunctional 4-hydroxy-2-oxoglutarate aldolase/2-dehydro-3-deoxy-phosphogluconate aldolase [Citrobacter]|jgi:2-dehydro-3-deoxyphosphogluconate aldolase/(4S)-4-hydroxy-2-oxoglutarate aldolase|uniref:bifunctional 4-hydroxy-2-oxoglutarate aldolase/2-dehydro-3-deoxy-phosphogluconate aldolase n=1 Tax=Citrobacter TaxID=544 RepID=UPI000C86C2EB|nr:MULTISPECIES: bifunctional 4-hydroxy-2-oxoglutarate aldolase/2-dehydro-3-deoxy-phosphogluconate aldolase [Citrobacter]AUO64921.1 2-dehydro-3-deoxyphosphogluconate aldolase [Citrobacter freundii complex sp. CFNIH2]MBJ9258796.1 bifunctional 4-hydroxy-2-oxoglutarate aldolase/2-dehydro-3-deoxy-phosphogluconate aldolase [Citrobacter amalonaticus]MCP1627588.1 2-dehydro-3-deoxyphosphogluconate aldolase/(4S)-4-hydroxy-2-oxoglutarate aldolase [Citrobacter amalonaticus]MDT7074973.1 bifunctional 4-hydr
MIKHRVIHAIEQTGLIAIVRGIDPESVLPLAEALYAGGVEVIEVTCNSTRYLESITALKTKMGDKMKVGAGTVINPVMAQLVIDAGADFVLSPDFNPDVISMVHEKQRLMIPAVMTPSEILQACRLGVDLLKLFPANSLGIDYLKEIQGPLDNLALIPVGGITLENTASFARAGAFAVGVGSALTNKQWVNDGEWEKITRQAEAFIRAFRDNKPR